MYVENALLLPPTCGKEELTTNHVIYQKYTGEYAIGIGTDVRIDN